MSLAKDVKLDKYTVPTGNWTPGRRMAVHYITAALRKLHWDFWKSQQNQRICPLFIDNVNFPK